MKVMTVVGARPQFVKAAAISRVIGDLFSDEVEEVLVHTGQHFDANMSKVFFEELEIPKPKHNLKISGGSHGEMTGRMLEAIEKVILSEKPDWLLIYGDTNSTLASALAAAKLYVPVAHVEAGLRSFNMRMPEEINRILSDRISSLLFCPTETAIRNLKLEGISEGLHNVGDVMYDVALFYQERARLQSTLTDLGLIKGNYYLATCHRAENTDDPVRLKAILSALAILAEEVTIVLPLHPRTLKLIEQYDFSTFLKHLIVTNPLSFLDMVALEQSAKLILTDSGGVQKEAFFYGVPCITMRDETEWVETVECGGNRLVPPHQENIVLAAQEEISKPLFKKINSPYGDGRAAEKILNLLLGQGR